MAHYYTTGEFARMAHVTIRTIRYYDKKGLLKPSFVNESGYRMYSDEDFLRLQKILSLKYLGFSLKEISNKTWRQMLPGLFDILQFHFHGQSRVLFRLQQQVHRDTASYLQCFCICFRRAI